jgi:hypothetical protein
MVWVGLAVRRSTCVPGVHAALHAGFQQPVAGRTGVLWFPQMLWYRRREYGRGSADDLILPKGVLSRNHKTVPEPGRRFEGAPGPNKSSSGTSGFIQR